MSNLTIILYSLFAMHVKGWGARGHMAISRVAFNLLSNRAHLFLASTTGAKVDINRFAQMSLWADRVRGHPDHVWSSQWHYTHNSDCLENFDSF